MPQHEIERQRLAQIQDQPHDLERPHDQLVRDQHEVIQYLDQQQRGRQIIVRYALIQLQVHRDLQPVRARPQEQEPNQAHQQEVVLEVAVALQEEEIIRYKHKKSDEKFNFNGSGADLHIKFLWPRPNGCFKIF